MILKIGDKVRFLNEVGGGRITSVINNDMVNVETDDGFEVPTLINNLIVVNPTNVYESGRTRNTVVQPKPAAPVEKKETKPVAPWFSDKNQITGKDDLQFLFVLVPEVPANPPDRRGARAKARKRPPTQGPAKTPFPPPTVLRSAPLLGSPVC